MDLLEAPHQRDRRRSEKVPAGIAHRWASPNVPQAIPEDGEVDLT
jgi:hypothetical protein